MNGPEIRVAALTIAATARKWNKDAYDDTVGRPAVSESPEDTVRRACVYEKYLLGESRK